MILALVVIAAIVIAIVRAKSSAQTATPDPETNDLAAGTVESIVGGGL